MTSSQGQGLSANQRSAFENVTGAHWTACITQGTTKQTETIVVYVNSSDYEPLQSSRNATPNQLYDARYTANNATKNPHRQLLGRSIVAGLQSIGRMKEMTFQSVRLTSRHRL